MLIWQLSPLVPIEDYPLYFLFPLIKGRVSEELLAPSPHHPRHVIALGSLPKLEELVVCSLSCVEIIHIEVLWLVPQCRHSVF